MKRFIIFCVLLIFIAAVPAHAAWTVTAEIKSGSPYNMGGGSTLYAFKITAVSDASGSGDQVLSTLLTTQYGTNESARLMKQIGGSLLFWVDYEPDATLVPTTETTITIDKETAALIFSEAVTTAATAQSWTGKKDTTDYMPITDVTVAMTTLANTKKAVVWLWFLGGRN